ncbi:MAG: DUF4124 domain-containing protein [Zoogloeaceae bacterium]|jgi:hypothetical protein|nr:DUF4124 domain-containing protein [Zoogloeaceae bacterium]
MYKASFPFWAVMGFACAALPAWGQVYRCVDANEHVTYTNLASEGKNCKRMASEPAVPASGSARVSGQRPGAAATPASFPRVSSDAQRARDASRRTILAQELLNEERSLEEARQALAEQEQIREGGEKNYQRVLDRLQPYKDEVARRERNIDAIGRELSALR